MKANRTQKCKVYRKCKNVPCGGVMNRCRPSYCVPGSSRNWSLCNMANAWGGKYKKKYGHLCKDESKCVLNKTRKVTKHTVDAKMLHSKMPYIWRFLKPKTRKHMIELAKKPIKDINIPFHVFPDKSSLYSLDKKIRKQMKNLREKYKNI
tara:strand:+ start:171 stop:620 length:450 start_codon:yes stop_codon:yes gene_type:complete